MQLIIGFISDGRRASRAVVYDGPPYCRVADGPVCVEVVWLYYHRGRRVVTATATRPNSDEEMNAAKAAPSLWSMGVLADHASRTNRLRRLWPIRVVLTSGTLAATFLCGNQAGVDEGILTLTGFSRGDSDPAVAATPTPGDYFLSCYVHPDDDDMFDTAFELNPTDRDWIAECDRVMARKTASRERPAAARVCRVCKWQHDDQFTTFNISGRQPLCLKSGTQPHTYIKAMHNHMAKSGGGTLTVADLARLIGKDAKDNSAYPSNVLKGHPSRLLLHQKSGSYRLNSPAEAYPALPRKIPRKKPKSPRKQ